jgi:hypothetical protein
LAHTIDIACADAEVIINVVDATGGVVTTDTILIFILQRAQISGATVDDGVTIAILVH